MGHCWKRWTCLLLCAAFFAFSGCLRKPVPESAVDSLAFTPQGEGVLVLVDSRADPIVRKGANQFCEYLTALSGGRIQASPRLSTNPAEEFRQGGAAFALLDGEAAETVSSAFAAMSRPYLYSGYDQFTMSLNSQKVLGRLGEALEPQGTIPLAAYYTGSHYYLSLYTLDDYSILQGIIIDGEEEPEEDTVPVAYVGMDSPGREGLAALGTDVQMMSLAGLRLEALLAGDIVAAEFSFEDSYSIQEDGEYLHFTRTWHSARPLWLLADAAVYRELEPAQQAAVLESRAHLFPVVDGAFLSREEEIMEMLVESGVAIDEDFTLTRREIRSLTFPAAPANTLERFLYETIDHNAL